MLRFARTPLPMENLKNGPAYTAETFQAGYTACLRRRDRTMPRAMFPYAFFVLPNKL